MTNQILAASRALAEATRLGRTAPLIPGMAGCARCGTMRMIMSPAPLGSCPACGTELNVLPRPQVEALSAPAQAA